MGWFQTCHSSGVWGALWQQCITHVDTLIHPGTEEIPFINATHYNH